jgi:hypothetical protein
MDWLTEFAKSAVWTGIKNVPGIGAVATGAEIAGSANDAIAEAAPAVGNMIARVAIIVLGFIFVAAGLMMFKPSVIVEASSNAGKAYRETKAANAALDE